MTFDQEKKTDNALAYQIKLKGYLGEEWASWFENVSIAADEDGNTWLTCLLADQAALYGLLKKIRDLGLFLLLLQYVEPKTDEPMNSESDE
jgi:hypothetical protein